MESCTMSLPVSYLIKHETELQFLQTHCACYERGVYYLGANQWVDSSLPGYLRVGAELNPAVPYWFGD